MNVVINTDLLVASAAYTSSAFPVEFHEHRVAGTIYSDQAGTLYIEQGDDGTNFDVTTSHSITATDGKGFTEPIVARYWRIRYVNGASDQGVFRVYAKPR